MKRLFRLRPLVVLMVAGGLWVTLIWSALAWRTGDGVVLLIPTAAGVGGLGTVLLSRWSRRR